MRTGMSQLVVTCALAMLLIASPHAAEGRCTTTCLRLCSTQLLPDSEISYLLPHRSRARPIYCHCGADHLGPCGIPVVRHKYVQGMAVTFKMS